MRPISRTSKLAFFITLGVCIAVAATVLSTSWIILNWREIVPLILGVVFFGFIIAGVILNTIFLVREVRRNEQQDSFLNAVTHELKTPITSIRLYLETLQKREIDDVKRHEFYQVMLDDTQRLMGTVEGVLRAARVTQKNAVLSRAEVRVGSLVQEAIDVARVRHHLASDAMNWATDGQPSDGLSIMGDREELFTAVTNVLDNAVKYSPKDPVIRVGVVTAGSGACSDPGPGQRCWHRSRGIEARIQALLPRNQSEFAGQGQRPWFVYSARHRSAARWRRSRRKRRHRSRSHCYH